MRTFRVRTTVPIDVYIDIEALTPEKAIEEAGYCDDLNDWEADGYGSFSDDISATVLVSGQEYAWDPRWLLNDKDKELGTNGINN